MTLPVSSINWIAENLKIINKQGLLVPLEPNNGQRMLNDVMVRQRAAGYPVRIILLKPRQVGWSTWSEAEGFYEINISPNRTALCVSADADSTSLVFNMTKIFQAEMPPELRRPTIASNRYEIAYTAPFRSRFLTQTAGKDVLGRGGTTHFFHGSETAYWPKAKESLASVLQMVSSTVDTTVILESTANGVGGAFYDMFWQAVERQKNAKSYQGYLPIFFPWFKFSEYQMPLRGKSLGNLDDTERDIKKVYDLTDEQIFWRRLKLEELNGDDAMFRQEYPANPLESFTTSGNPVFSEVVIRNQRERCTPEPRYCVFSGSDLRIEDVNRSFNCWQMAHQARAGHEYSIGIDTMEGRLSDVQDIKSKLDCDAVVVLDRGTSEVVCMYHGRGNQQDLGYQCLWSAQYYNNAWVAPEIPHSMTVLGIFKEAGYQNLYNRQVHDEQFTSDDSENLGWRTTLVTRKWLVDGLIGLLRDKAITVMFSEIVEEMRTFIKDKTGKPIHMPSKHDDLLFALMIAIQIHLRCPLGVQPYQYSCTGESEIKKRESLSTAGMIDDLSDIFLEEDQEQLYTE